MSTNLSSKNHRNHALIIASLMISATMVSGCRLDDSFFKKYPSMCRGYCVGVENLDKDGCLSLNGTWHPDDCVNEVLPEVEGEGEGVTPAANEDECTAHSGNWKPGYCEISKTVCQEKVKLENSEIEYNKGYCMGAKELNQEECEKELTDGKPIGKWDNDHCVIDDLRCQDIHSSLENIQWLELEWHDLDYRILDIGEGEYIRCIDFEEPIDNRICKEFACGTMAQITSENPPPCDMTKTKYKQAVADMEESLPGSICQKDAVTCVEVKILPPNTEGNSIGMCSSCPQDNLVCENKCVNVMNDHDNCGGCKNACGEHEYCNNGICDSTEVCSKPKIDCYCTGDETSMSCTDIASEQAQRACIDPKSNNYCGATDCGHLGVQCSVGQSCDQGECKCPEGLVKSEDGSTCLTPYSPETCGITEDDVENGVAPRVCDTEKELCDGQTCQCRQGYQSCDGGESCIDVLINNDHCGVCNNPCDENADCINGQCICKDGFSRCDTEGCDDKKKCEESSQVQHCGAKGSANDPDENCDNWRGKVCAENNKCRLIDNVYQCVCPEKFLIFDDVCIDPEKSVQHCGAKTDYNGIDCTVNGYETQCVAGNCVCSTGLTFVAIYEENGAQKYVTTSNEIREASKREGVQYDCIDTMYNSNCCGSDCEKCGENKVCTDSHCGTACKENSLNCNGVCMNKSEYNITADGETNCKCRSGFCPIGGDPNKGCPFVLNDDNNCGECGKKCPSTMTCTPAGECICNVDYYDSCTFAIDLYEHNSESVDLCIPYNLTESEKDSLEKKHIVREKNCTEPGTQGYQCDNDGTPVCHKCEEHWANLDGDWSNGCETDLSNNVTNCGAIGNNCNDLVQNAAGVACVNNQCVFTVCNSSDYLNCNDKDYSEGTSYLISNDGCETNVSTDPNSCGRCDRKCTSGNCENSECCYKNNTDIYEDVSQFKCCDGQRLIKYKYNIFGCLGDTRNGCIDQDADKPSACWYDQ